MIQLNCVTTIEDENSLISVTADANVSVLLSRHGSEERFELTWAEATTLKDMLILAENNV